MTNEEALNAITAFVENYACGSDLDGLKEAIEALKRPHGDWIPFEWDSNYKTKIPLPKGSDSHMEEYWDEEFICSVCGKAHHARNFCPNCGADMRDKKDDLAEIIEAVQSIKEGEANDKDPDNR